MSYRSAVLFEIPVDKYDQFWEAIKDGVASHVSDYDTGDEGALQKEVDDVLERMRQSQFPDRYIFFHPYTSWYTDDFACSVIEQAVYDQGDYTFIRTGEDREDCEMIDALSTPWVMTKDVSLLATKDALGTAITYLNLIEQAESDVRIQAIEALEAVLGKLYAAEGMLRSDDDAFELEG